VNEVAYKNAVKTFDIRFEKLDVINVPAQAGALYKEVK
jgi:hypothetical protein